MATYYVSTSGVDSSSRTGLSSSQSWASLSYACAHAQNSGDIIHVAAGNYTDASQCILEEGVTIVGAGRNITTIVTSFDGAAPNPYIKAESWNGWNGTYGNQSISGITFDGNLITYSCISVNFRSNVIIYDCNFYDFSRRGVVFWGAPYDYWGDVLPYYTSHKMPDKWCTGNKIYDCYFENCAYYETNGTGNLNFGQQDGFEAYNITIDQTARLGYGIKFYERGFNKNTKIYNCDIEVQPRPENTGGNTYYNFAIEMWWDMGGCEYYNNRLRGHFDITGTVDVESGYTSWVHDNIIGWDVTTDHLEVGLSLEAIIYDVIINNNVFKNVTSGVMFQQLFPNKDWPIDNHMENLQVYNNIITVGIVPGGWTYGQLVGISFTESRGDKTGKDAFIYNNTVICEGFGSRTDIYGVAGISYYCYTDWDGFYVKNNIFQGFTGGTLRSGFFVGVGYSEMNYLTFENNLLYGNGYGNQPYFTSNFDSGTNYSMADNVTESPGFVSPFDYHLDDDSPAIAAGQYVGLLTDFDGYQWLNPPSIGAYEYEEEIIEGDPPVANFSANVTSIYEGNIVTFTDLSTESPTSWSWTFGDSGTSTSQNPSHVYSTAGVYTVTLTATNAYGVDAEVKTNYITVTVPVVTPVADFTVDDTTIYEGQTVYFTDQTLNAPTSWSWNFGDGGTSTSQNPYHTYATAGSYTVSLTATNSSGSDTETKTNYIIVSAIIIAPVAQFTVNDTTIIEGESVSFTDQSTNSPVSWLWSFGDSTTSTSQNPSHIYSTSGTYTVTLTATNSAGSDVETKVDYITVSPAEYAPIAGFYATSTTALVHSNIFFVDTSTNTPTSWYWDFGDGFNSANQHPSHQYNTSGVYTVSLTAYNAFGNDIETKTDYITIEEEPVGPAPSGCMTTFAKFYKVFVVPSIPPVSAFKFIFDDIGNAPVADPSSVSDWNTFLDLPTFGTPFTSVSVNGNEVTLKGGSNIKFKDYLFGNDACAEHIIEVEDTGSVVELGESVFCGGEDPWYTCDLLTTAIFPFVTTVGDWLFCDCHYLTIIDLSSLSVESFEASTGLYSWCYSLSDVSKIVPIGITHIPDFTFTYTALTSYEIPDTVETLGYAVFQECYDLASIIIPDSITYLGIATFNLCESLTEVILPDTITTIDDQVFGGCIGIESITIPDSVTSIGAGTFGYTSITEITLPVGIISIGADAFTGCPLTTITIPDDVTAISDFTFRYCDALVSIVLPPNLISIGQYAFTDCSSLSSISIPDTLTSIGTYAFSGCSALSIVNIYSTTAPTVNVNTSFGDYAATLHIQSGSTGYGVNPWINTSKFSSIVQDL